jgi:MFS family permease
MTKEFLPGNRDFRDQSPALEGPLTVNNEKSPPVAWVVTGMVVVFIMLNWADKAALGLTGTSIMRDLHLTSQQFGLLGSAYFFLYAVSTIVFGWIGTKLPVNKIMAGLVIAWGLVMLPIALGGGFAVLFGSRLLLGASEAPATPFGNFMAHSWFPDRRRTLAGTLVMLGSPLGILVAAPVVTWVMVTLGWRMSYLFLALFGVLWAAIWMFVGREGPFAGRADRTQPGGVGASTLFQVAKNKIWIASTLAAFGAYWATTLSATWLPTYFTKALGYSQSITGMLITVTPAISIATMLAWGAVGAWMLRRGLSTRWARAGLLALTMVLGGGLICAGMSADNVTAIVVLTSAGLGLSQPVYPLVFLLVSEVSPAQSRAFAMGLSAAVSTLAGIVAPWLTGRLVGESGLGYTAAFLICAVLMILGGLLVLACAPALPLQPAVARGYGRQLSAE